MSEPKHATCSQLAETLGISHDSAGMDPAFKKLGNGVFSYKIKG